MIGSTFFVTYCYFLDSFLFFVFFISEKRCYIIDSAQKNLRFSLPHRSPRKKDPQTIF